MLRASAQVAGVTIDLRSIGDRSRNPGRDDAAVLLRFTDALVGRTDDLDRSREALVDGLGRDAVALAAAAAGNFEMMNRIVDGVGVVVPSSLRAMAPAIGLDIGQA
jgi:hypothetical protein